MKEKCFSITFVLAVTSVYTHFCHVQTGDENFKCKLWQRFQCNLGATRVRFVTAISQLKSPPICLKLSYEQARNLCDIMANRIEIAVRFVDRVKINISLKSATKIARVNEP